MLSLFRVFLGTWAARAFFVVLVGAFALWGIGDVIRNLGHDTSVAIVGDTHIEPPAFQAAYHADLNEVGRGKQPTPEMRHDAGERALERLIFQAALAEEVERLGIAVPDAALRQAVFDVPQFRGANNVFDHGIFETLIRNQGLTEARYLENLRTELAQRQLIETIQAGVSSPKILIDQLFAFQHEQRVGQIVQLAAAAAPPPPAPTAAELQRYYENNPASYTAPAYRRIVLIVLSPATLARSIAITDADISAYYDQHRQEFLVQGQRAANVIVAPDQATAEKLSALWKAGADWTKVGDAAKQANAPAIGIDLSTREQFPSAELAAAVFAAKPDTVEGPIQSAGSWDLFEVTKVVEGKIQTLEQAKPAIRERLALERATDQVYTTVGKIDDQLSAGTPLDRLPGDLGVIAVTGTTDAQGTAPTGDPASIPGPAALRQAILQSAFATSVGEPPHMIEGPNQTYYALSVESITPSALKPLQDVTAQLRADWTEAQKKRHQEKVAAQLMTAAQAGGSLEQAANLAGAYAERTPVITRMAPAPNLAPAVQQALFSLRRGDATMVETPDGFTVVRLDTVTDPDPASDPAGTSQIRETMDRAIAQDEAVTVAEILRTRAAPRVNRTLLNSLIE